MGRVRIYNYKSAKENALRIEGSKLRIKGAYSKFRQVEGIGKAILVRSFAFQIHNKTAKEK